MNDIKLTLCIATYNRAAFIGYTLESIITQLTDEVEIVVVDGASTDKTAEVVKQYMRRCSQLFYYRQEVNSGVDKDFACAVELSSGEYCWLMTDDDILKPHAICKVLNAIRSGYGLVLVNAEVRNSDLSKVLENRRLHFTENRSYKPADNERLFTDSAKYLSFIGCVVIKKSIWEAREKAAYFGTEFIHVGVIFQSRIPDDVLVIAEPLIAIRYGNAQWSVRGFEIWMLKWPRLIWSFKDFSDKAKSLVCPREPWKKFTTLLFLRGLGVYSMREYENFLSSVDASAWQKIVARSIAGLQGKLVNLIALFYFMFVRRSPTYVLDLKISRNYWRALNNNKSA